tara:strand:+ start:17367 stop:18344 length:978 start_codon:yes stop_codon:yes gene_type:complete
MKHLSLFSWSIYLFSVAVPLNLCTFILWDLSIPPIVDAGSALIHVGIFMLWGIMMAAMFSISIKKLVKLQDAVFETALPAVDQQALAPAKLFVSELAERAGLTRTPRIALIDTYELNASAVSDLFGRSAIVFTRGSLNLPRSQLRALTAHEMAHIARGDSLVQAFIASLIFQTLWGFLDSASTSVSGVAKRIIWVILFGGALMLGLSEATEISVIAQLQSLAWLVVSVLFVVAVTRLIQFAVKTQTTFGHKALNRHLEMKADKLAAKWVPPVDVLMLLQTLKASNVNSDDMGWLDSLNDTHPSFKKRISQVELIQSKQTTRTRNI